MGQPRSHMGTQLVGFGRGRGIRGYDRGTDDLTPSTIGYADHRRLAHPRMIGEDRLDLRRVDVLATTDDAVVQPALEEYETLLVDTAKVTGLPPAVSVGSEQVGGPDGDFAAPQPVRQRQLVPGCCGHFAMLFLREYSDGCVKRRLKGRLVTIKVGFLGVGQMGRPMVGRLLAGDLPVTFYARRPEVAAEVTAAGARSLDSPGAVASECDVLIVCLFSDAQVEQLLADGGVLAAMQPGAVLVNHVTGSPALARELAAAAPAGVGYVDAPVSGSAESIAAGELTILAGGDSAHLESARPALETYASPIIPVGGVGDAQLVKLVNNLLFTVHLRIAGEITDLAASQGIERTALVEALHHCSGHSFALDVLAASPFAETRENAGPYLRKDIGAVREVAAELGMDLGLLGELAGWVDDAAG
jgi:3-hydroxyisobutyrate dehydrogenase-like beta-hydroxyacid dehydrogenase